MPMIPPAPPPVTGETTAFSSTPWQRWFSTLGASIQAYVQAYVQSYVTGFVSAAITNSRASGSGVSAGGAATVSFPAGRFDSAPVVQATVHEAPPGTVAYSISVGTVTTTTADVYVVDATGALVAGIPFYYTAQVAG